MKDHINDREGSSPLARGLLAVKRSLGELLGIIPARAGFTPRTARGTVVEPGSSPLARGLREAVRHPPGRDGIIPARAGFTHPADPAAPLPSGSSPLARGLLVPPGEGDLDAGIIPARAGFTSSTPPIVWSAMDHPRSRGVYDAAYVYGVATRWIIPARAGFTRPPSRPPCGGRDHPRSRGVYGTTSSLRPPVTGSSPLARGLPPPTGWRGPSLWIIPARAGFTERRQAGSAARRDHPRSRGVYWGPSASTAAAPGSSPLARGLRRVIGRVIGVGGIIPARAGFTAA